MSSCISSSMHKLACGQEDMQCSLVSISFNAQKAFSSIKWLSFEVLRLTVLDLGHD